MKKSTTKKVNRPKAKNKRSKNKFSALDPKLNLKSRAELIDFDYVDKLTDKEKEFLNTFSEEFNNANFSHGKKILHKSRALKKDCYGMNNRRNRDILTRAKAMGNIEYIEDIKNGELQDMYGEIGQDFTKPRDEPDDESNGSDEF